MIPLISIVVPTRKNEAINLTMDSLMKQTFQNVEIIVVVDYDERGAPWARNRGAEKATGKYLLFSDSDIEWAPDALTAMRLALDAAYFLGNKTPDWTVGYAYGSYRITQPGQHHPPVGVQDWDWPTLRGRNYVSTMSLMVRELFPGFDESLKRLQDWDLWLTLGAKKIRGVYVGKELFTTPHRKNGITHGSVSYEDAHRALRRKHGL